MKLFWHWTVNSRLRLKEKHFLYVFFSSFVHAARVTSRLFPFCHAQQWGFHPAVGNHTVQVNCPRIHGPKCFGPMHNTPILCIEDRAKIVGVHFNELLKNILKNNFNIKKLTGFAGNSNSSIVPHSFSLSPSIVPLESTTMKGVERKSMTWLKICFN